MNTPITRRSLVAGAAGAAALAATPLAEAAGIAGISTAAAEEASARPSFRPGTYTGTGTGNGGPVVCRVTFSTDAVESVEVVRDSESPTMFAGVRDYVIGCILDGQTLNVEAVSGATMSTNALLDAVADAALNTLPGRIVEAQSVGIDTVAGATFTSRAILTAVAKCLEQAGGAPAVRAFMGRVRTPEPDDTPQQIDVDVVVVGSGMAGVCAALAAQDAGARVAVVEKLPFVGGTSQTSGAGVIHPNSADPADIEDYIALELNYQCGPLKGTTQDAQYPNPAIVSMVANNILGDVDWLRSKGMTFNVYDNMPAGDVAVFQMAGSGVSIDDRSLRVRLLGRGAGGRRLRLQPRHGGPLRPLLQGRAQLDHRGQHRRRYPDGHRRGRRRVRRRPAHGQRRPCRDERRGHAAALLRQHHPTQRALREPPGLTHEQRVALDLHGQLLLCEPGPARLPLGGLQRRRCRPERLHRLP